jgi:hypothetical protein
MYLASNRNMHENFFFLLQFLLAPSKSMAKIGGSGSESTPKGSGTLLKRTHTTKFAGTRTTYLNGTVSSGTQLRMPRTCLTWLTRGGCAEAVSSPAAQLPRERASWSPCPPGRWRGGRRTGRPSPFEAPRRCCCRSPRLASSCLQEKQL